VNPEIPQDPKPGISIVIDGVAVPRVQGRVRVDVLLKLGTPHAYASLLEFERDIESPALLTYLGHRLGEGFNPELIPHIELGFQKKSFAFIGGFLASMATHEYHGLVMGRPARIEGAQYAGVRRLLAEVCCEPMYAVTEGAWDKYQDQVYATSTLPLTILRRVAGPEVAEVALKALTKGGVGSFGNRKALDLLKLFEERSTAPHLSEEQTLKLLKVYDGDLRHPTVYASISSLVGTWLRKHQETPPKTVRDALLQTVQGLSSESALDVDNELLRLLGALTMLQHFKDDGVQHTLRSAVKLNDPCISPLALLCRADFAPNFKNYLKSMVTQSGDLEDRLSALRVFGQSISPEVDRLTFPILQKYLIESDEMLGDQEYRDVALRERRVLLEAASRRFLCEPVDSPFITGILHSARSDVPEFAALRVFAVNVLAEVSTSGQLPPVWFYDDVERLKSVLAAANYLDERMAGITFKGIKSPSEHMREYFFSIGPKHYGFEVDVA